MSDKAIVVTLSLDYCDITLPFSCGFLLDAEGRLKASHVRKAVISIQKAKEVKVGQMVAVLKKDGSPVVDIRSGCLFADKNGKEYFITETERREFKVLNDSDYFELAGEAHIHIVAFTKKL